MFGVLLVVVAIAAQALFVRADPNPTTPGPGSVYNEGSNCPILWDLDPSGTWTGMTIQLMTGNNLNMVPLLTVATVDATKTTSFTWPCPMVTPNSAIYFYQFTNPRTSNNTLWTTRFAIADQSGATTPPLQHTQPNGQLIDWGTGAIVGSQVSTSTSFIQASSSTSFIQVPASASFVQSSVAAFIPGSSGSFLTSSISRSTSIPQLQATNSVGAGSATSGAITVGVRQASCLAIVLAAATSILM